MDKQELTYETALNIAREFLLEKHKNNTQDVASIILATEDEPKKIAWWLRQHIDFLQKVAEKIEEGGEK